MNICIIVVSQESAPVIRIVPLEVRILTPVISLEKDAFVLLLSVEENLFLHLFYLL